MNLLKHIALIKNLGFARPQVKEISCKDDSDWIIEQMQRKIVCLEKNILLELEDGSEHKLSEDKVFDISRVTTEEDKAKYLIALKAA